MTHRPATRNHHLAPASEADLVDDLDSQIRRTRDASDRSYRTVRSDVLPRTAYEGVEEAFLAVVRARYPQLRFRIVRRAGPGPGSELANDPPRARKVIGRLPPPDELGTHLERVTPATSA